MRLFILILFSLFGKVSLAQETMYVPPGAEIQFGNTTTAGIFGYLVNDGNLSIKKKRECFFQR